MKTPSPITFTSTISAKRVFNTLKGNPYDSVYDLYCICQTKTEDELMSLAFCMLDRIICRLQ